MPKTDNKSLQLKVELRRQVLHEAKLGDLQVLDLYAGEGLIWQEVSKRMRVHGYTPVDNMPRMPGTLKAKVTASFLQAFDMSRYNVVDVDTYGEPWLSWGELFPRIEQKTVFFLTHGAVSGAGGANVSKYARELMGIPKDWPVPMKRELAVFADRYILLRHIPTARVAKGYRIVLRNVTYYGLICQSTQLSLGFKGRAQ